MTFRHVIMTRFNLATPGREASFRNQPGWLEGRFRLFERYCLPTVAAQDSQEFDWIIYFDIETPAPFRERVEAAQQVRPFTAYYTGLFPSEGWRRSVIEEFGDERPRRLLTTVLDNDDGLAVDFVSRLHSHVREYAGDRAAFNFTNGYVLSGRRLYAHSHPSSAFANILEPYDGAFRTASDIPHMELARHLPMVQLPGPGAWLQVVHGGNVSNKIRGRRVGRHVAEERFPSAVIAEVVDPTATERLVEGAIAGPLRWGRDRLIAAVRSARRRGRQAA